MPRLLSRLVSPGTRLMQRLPMSFKLALLAACMSLPLLVLVAWLAHDLSRSLDTLQAERDGLRATGAVLPLLAVMHHHEGLAMRVTDGDAQATGPRDAAARRMATLSAGLDALDPAARAMLGETWPPLRDRLAALPRATGADAVRTAHNDAATGLRQMLAGVVERSGLLLDPQAQAYFAIVALVHHIAPWTEDAAELRAAGTALLMRDGQPPDPREALRAVSGRLSVHVDTMQGALEALQRTGQEMPPSWAAARTSTLALMAWSAEQAAAARPQGDAAAFDRLGADALDGVAALADELHQGIDTRLAERHADLVRRGTLTGLGALLSLLALGYLGTSFYLAFRDSLDRLLEGVRTVAEGDLSRPVQVPGSDELARVGAWVDRTNERLSALVSQVRSASMHVDLAGRQVAGGSAALSHRTEEQAGHLHHAVQIIRTVSDDAAENARAAAEVDTLATRLLGDAETGGRTMTATEETIARMEDSSRRVAEVVDVIDDIAFQTGMLALNAAVEASRAGEAGRGFGVVASEVRGLSQRCAESAEQIRQLVQEAGDHVGHTAEQVREVGRVLQSLREGAQQVGERLATIRDASASGSERLAEVAQSIGNLDDITRQNAGLVEEASSAAHELVNRAQGMRGAVGLIRLRQGSVDEAQALVERGRAHVAAVGSAAALRDFNNPAGGYTDRDLYLFAFDREGHCLAFAAEPRHVGRLAKDIPGLDARNFLAATWAAADAHAEGGWARYRALNPRTRRVEEKESFVVAIGAHELIGCGVYRDGGSSAEDFVAGANAPAAEHEAAA